MPHRPHNEKPVDRGARGEQVLLAGDDRVDPARINPAMRITGHKRAQRRPAPQAPIGLQQGVAARDPVHFQQQRLLMPPYFQPLPALARLKKGAPGGQAQALNLPGEKCVIVF